MALSEVWCRVTVLGPGGATLSSCLLAGDGRQPDLADIDQLARLQLSVVRRGEAMVLSDVGSELSALLELVGLRRQMCGQPEGREDRLDVEERGDRRDPSG
jgi:hypothetical protein